MKKLALLIAALAAVLIQSPVSAELTAKANHDNISIDFFYHGSTVSVSGVSDPDVDLIIAITSPEEHQVLKEKGKVAGFLWMNVKTLQVAKAPGLYEVYSTKKIDELLSSEEQRKYVLGYQALAGHVELQPVVNEEERSKWFGEFVKFKEQQRLYDASAGGITFSMEGGKRHYYILTPWPYQAAPGEYTVTVYAVKDKRVVETASSKVNVQQVGTVKALAGMARNNASLYGILSIVAALGAGFGVGMVFRKGGGAH